jgi:DNA-binding NtrC family response regulator
MTRREPGDHDIATQLRPNAFGARPLIGFRIVVTGGNETGQVLAVRSDDSTRVYVGKSPTCNLRLTDALVSRRHAAFELADGRLRVTDLQSTNGTWVNGARIIEAVLYGSETLRIGDTTLSVERDETAGASGEPGATKFGRLIGISAAMRRLYPYFERLAKSDIPVIIEGETGTGKELLAESIHEANARANGPFIVFDCTAVPPNLMESALFGHERGAFTGAVNARAGVFEQAQGGTLFIDEIGDLDSSLQPKLLRALERGEVQRVGSNRWVKADVRLIVATRRDLEREIQAGRFRDDLYYRLAVARAELPPLRKRTGDISFLATHFWTLMGGAPGSVPHEFLERLELYSWPGNVRELRNAVAHRYALGELSDPRSLQRAEGAAAQADGASVAPPASVPASEPTPDVVDEVIREGLPFFPARERVLASFNERFVAAVLARHGGNVSKAAAASGIARRYFYVLRGPKKP